MLLVCEQVYTVSADGSFAAGCVRVYYDDRLAAIMYLRYIHDVHSYT